MAVNSTVVGAELPYNSMRRFSGRASFVQVLVFVFLAIDSMLLFTFLMKSYFYTTMRYIFFAVILVSDSLILIVTNYLFLTTILRIPVPMWFCVLLYPFSSVYTFVTPVTLTAMSLERYVAICMPLRHAELCSTRSSLHCILIIQGLSSVPCIVVLSIFFPTVSLSFYTQYKVCNVEVFIQKTWQRNVRSAVCQAYFLIMFLAIVFSYVKIMKVAKTASGEDKKSTFKGLKTVLLHGFQLLLSLTQLWTPFMEAAVLKIDFNLFLDVQYSNYILFSLVSRFLSPLIYGLRDEKFFLALKSYVLCSSLRKK